jgi:hypothetical protein
MKRALVLLSLAAGALPGCATAPVPGAEATLDAKIYSEADGPRISLSEPAYVAIFHVGQGRGDARLVYPEPGAEQVMLRRGTQSLAAANVAWNLTTRYQANVVWYMVASREPLDLSGFAESRNARGTIGAHVLQKNVHQIAGALAQAVVPDPESRGWTDAILYYDGRSLASARAANRSRRIDSCGFVDARRYRTPQGCPSR